MRWFNSDLPTLRCLPYNRLVYIEAPAEVRWQRSLRDAQKPDEANATFEQFLARDGARTEIEIPRFKNQAELVINNSVDDMQILENQVLQFVRHLDI